MWVWLGSAWARYFALSLPTAAAAAAAAEAPVARAGSVLRFRGVLGVAAWPAEAVARPAGATVATPPAPDSLFSAAVAAAGEAPVARAGFVPRFRGVLGVGAWPAEAVARPAGAVVATPRAPSSLSSAAAAALGDAPGSCAGATPLCRRRAGGRGRGCGVARWGCGLRFLRVSGPLPGQGGRACCLGGGGGHLGWLRLPTGSGGPTSTATSASLRSSRSARVSPVHSGEAGERERDRRWWRSSRWVKPSESALTVVLVGMRGGRRALPTTSRCISAVPWAVPCRALRGGGGEGVGGRLWRQLRTAGAGGHPLALGGEAGEPCGPRVAPQLRVWGRARGPGPPGVVGWFRGEPH